MAAPCTKSTIAPVRRCALAIRNGDRDLRPRLDEGMSTMIENRVGQLPPVAVGGRARALFNPRQTCRRDVPIRAAQVVVA